VSYEYFRILFLLSCLNIFGQSAIVLDEENKLPIAYVNIWNKSSKRGVSTEENGTFSTIKLKINDTLLFTAIGFETKEIHWTANSDTIFLTPKMELLNEVVVRPKKKLTFQLLKIRKANHSVHFWEHNEILIIAKHIPYQNQYENTPFLKEVTISTFTLEKDNIVKIYFYTVDENNQPKEYLLNENVTVRPKKGSGLTKIDVSKYAIEIPKNGLFIGVEVPKIKQNEINPTKGYRPAQGYMVYEPGIKMTDVGTEKDTWNYSNGKWSVSQRLSLAMQIELTN
jgi:hypothetical protein